MTAKAQKKPDDQKHNEVWASLTSMQENIEMYLSRPKSHQTNDVNIFALAGKLKKEYKKLVLTTGSVDNEDYDVTELIKQLPAGKHLMRYETGQYAVAELTREYGIHYTVMPITDMGEDPRFVLVSYLIALAKV